MVDFKCHEERDGIATNIIMDYFKRLNGLNVLPKSSNYKRKTIVSFNLC